MNKTEKSDTPETDTFMQGMHPAVRYPDYEAQMQKLERERDEARKIAERWIGVWRQVGGMVETPPWANAKVEGGEV